MGKVNKKKGRRDPGAPKRNLNSFLLFQHSIRVQYQHMAFSDFSRLASTLYASLSSDVKEVWSKRAEEDKRRYLEELAHYVPPPGFDARGDPIQAPLPKLPSRKTNRDPNAPKRNLSAYLLYQNAMRNQFTRDNPDMEGDRNKFGRLAKYTSHMWKNLSPDERTTWEARAQQDKERYDRELQTYLPPPGHDKHGVFLDEDVRASRMGRKRKAARDPLAPKRSSGAYVFFTNDSRAIILEENPGISFIDLGKELGERWRSLNAMERQKYEQIAAQDKIRFKQEMAEYNARRKLLASQTSFVGPSGSSTSLSHHSASLPQHQEDDDAIDHGDDAFYDTAASLDGLDTNLYVQDNIAVHSDDPYVADFC